MKKILHFLIISFFSFTIVSCAQINTLKDELGSKYDELSSGSDETVDTDASEAPAAKAESSRPLFVSVGGKGTIITSSNGTKWTRRTSRTKAKLRAVTTAMIPLLRLVFPEPSSLLQMESYGLEVDLEQKDI